MAAKKSKKSKQELIKAVIEGLSTDDPTGVGGPLLPDSDGTKSAVDRALVNPSGGELFHDTRTLPLGISSRTSVMQIGELESSDVSSVEPEESKLEVIEGLVDESTPSIMLKPLPNVSASEEMTRVMAPPSRQMVAAQPSANDKTAVLSTAAPTTLIEEHRDPTYIRSHLGGSVQNSSSYEEDSEKTVVVGIEPGRPDSLDEKISFGVARPSTRTPGSQGAMAGDAQVGQAENLRIAQERMVELEKELEKLRAENEKLSSANSSGKDQLDEALHKIAKLEKVVANTSAQFESELEIHRDGATSKDSEIAKLRRRVDELEGRLQQDLRKVRVRERELENRLELTKMEKESLLRSKDEAMLDLKRKIDNLNYELQGYRQRVTDLNQRIESNTDQFSRTVRALRLALTNLEVNDSGGSMTITPLKKAE